MINYSIGITTYDYRFEKYFIKLVDQISSYRPNIPIIVTINGNYKEQFNEEYRKNILNYCSKINNVFPIMFPTFRGLSKLWNTCLIHSPTDKMLILNDDISINHENFFLNLETKLDLDIFKINKSWSHYYIDRKIVNEIGWFDERLLGIGEEDGDFEYRWCCRYNKKFPNIHISDIFNYVEHDGACKNMNIVFGKYSAFNRSFMYNNKYKVDIENGVQGGIIPQPLVCNNPVPTQYTIESFFWQNSHLL
jgi:hypothetical protein